MGHLSFDIQNKVDKERKRPPLRSCISLTWYQVIAFCCCCCCCVLLSIFMSCAGKFVWQQKNKEDQMNWFLMLSHLRSATLVKSTIKLHTLNLNSERGFKKKKLIVSACCFSKESPEGVSFHTRLILMSLFVQSGWSRETRQIWLTVRLPSTVNVGIQPKIYHSSNFFQQKEGIEDKYWLQGCCQ